MDQFTVGAQKTSDGKLALNNPRAFKRLIAEMPIGKLTIRVKVAKPQRTLDQNAYLHAEPFPKLATFFGQSVEETKYVLMGEKWGWHRDPITGREIPFKPSTSSMTVEECTEFIDWLIPWALDKWGIHIELPE